METQTETTHIETTECNWIQDIPLQPINEFEKEMLSNTKSAEELLKEEQEEIPEQLTDEEIFNNSKKEYINKIKVVALDKLGIFPLSNPSTFPLRLKTKVQEQMEQLIKHYGIPELITYGTNENKQMLVIPEELTKDFNNVCVDKIFVDNVDYSKFPIYK